jgi:hypothetical protein
MGHDSDDNDKRPREALNSGGGEESIFRGRGDIGTWRRAKLERDREERRNHVRNQVAHYDPPAYDSVRLGELRIDERYQRNQSEAKVARLRATFVAQACQPLDVSERKDGSRWVMDGQHRLAVLVDAGVPDWTALIYKGLSPREESMMWFAINTGQSKPNANACFKSLLHHREHEAVTINSVVIGSGFKVSLRRGGRHPISGGEIDAIDAIIRIFRKSKEPGLADVLTTIAKAWPDPDEGGRTQRLVLLGVDAFIHGGWDHEVDLERAARVIGKWPPTTWVNKTRVQMGTKPAELFASFVRQAYNRCAPRGERLGERL